MSRLNRIKAEQLAEAEKTGVNPYDMEQFLGVDSATGKHAVHASVSKSLDDYQMALEIDIAKIAAVPDITDKVRIKATVLPTYLDFVNDYVKSGVNYPNTVAVQVMIWLLDTLQIEAGLNLALHLIKQRQRMPTKFDRDIPTFVCDFFYDWASLLLKENLSASPYLDVLIATAENEQWDLHPLIFSKLWVMLAKHKERNGEFETALQLCFKAEQINPEKAGVKGMKERLQAQLQKPAPHAGSESQAADALNTPNE